MSELEFTDERLERYSRHILLQNVGIEGQAKLFRAKVLIIGAGGLGSPVALYLAAAGVGTIGIADADCVDLSNLQRQVIHHTPDIGKPKVESAAEKMRAINPDVEVRTHHEFVRAGNIRQIIRDYDFVIDGTDNFAAKFLINDACVLERKPFSHGGILRFNGQTTTVLPGKSACYRCIFKAPPPKGVVPTCSEAGILGAVAGMLGTIQAAEALKFITGAGELLTNSLLVFDATDMHFSKVQIKPDPRCGVCGENPTINELADEEQVVCELKAARGVASC
ncbi:MAG: ThiF family adenylyltransferase [Terriglobales bacterium]